MIDSGRIATLLVALTLGLLAGFFGQPLVHGNQEAISVIVNVFSILAGFLVTIMTLLGEPSLFRGHSWRADAVKKGNVFRRLVRHKWLFILYLLVLGLIFVSTLITKTYPDHKAVIWIERTYLGMATVAFVLSLTLPSRLMNLQLARFNEMVEMRKNPANNTDHPDQS